MLPLIQLLSSPSGSSSPSSTSSKSSSSSFSSSPSASSSSSESGCREDIADGRDDFRLEVGREEEETEGELGGEGRGFLSRCWEILENRRVK